MQVASRAEKGTGTKSGTLYFLAHAHLRSVRSTTRTGAAGDAVHLFEENVIPVEWRWVNAVDADRSEAIASKARPEILKAFRDHVTATYPSCSAPGAKGDCWGVQLYLEVGSSEQEVRQKQAAQARQASGSQQILRQSSFSYRTSVIYEDGR